MTDRHRKRMAYRKKRLESKEYKQYQEDLKKLDSEQPKKQESSESEPDNMRRISRKTINKMAKEIAEAGVDLPPYKLFKAVSYMMRLCSGLTDGYLPGTGKELQEKVAGASIPFREALDCLFAAATGDLFDPKNKSHKLTVNHALTAVMEYHGLNYDEDSDVITQDETYPAQLEGESDESEVA